MKTRLGDIDVACTVQGDGPPVLLIHGLAESKDSWAGVQQRVADFRTHAYDFRGHGETTLGEGDGTLEQLGGDLIACLEEITGPAQCVGYSLGGTIVLWAAAQRPDLVTAAVVTGTSTVVGRQAVGFFEDRIRMIEEDFAAFAPALQQDTALQIVTSGVNLEEVTARRLKAVGTGGGYVNAARAMMRLHENPLTPLLSKIQCPVSVIGGAEDVFCPRKAADIMLAELKNSTFQEVAHAGHLLSVDQPEAYATAIHTALQRKIDG